MSLFVFVIFCSTTDQLWIIRHSIMSPCYSGIPDATMDQIVTAGISQKNRILFLSWTKFWKIPHDNFPKNSRISLLSTKFLKCYWLHCQIGKKEPWIKGRGLHSEDNKKSKPLKSQKLTASEAIPVAIPRASWLGCRWSSLHCCLIVDIDGCKDDGSD